MIPGNANPLLLASAADAAAAAVATKSLRFNDGDSAYLSRTPSSAGNRKTFTIAFWAKRTEPSTASKGIISARSSGNGDFIRFSDDGPNNLRIYGDGSYDIQTTRVFRDVSAWYHFVIAFDTTQATEADRIKLYINGVEEENLSSTSYPSPNADTRWNSTIQHDVGRVQGTTYMDGYLCDIFMIDGSQLDATSFGAFDDNGVWQAAAYSGTYGTNGFHLAFDDITETVAADSSGNDNDFTVNNIAVGGAKYSSTLTATSAHPSGRPASNGFDGVASSTDANSFLANSGGDVVWDASSYGFTNVEVEVYVFGVGGSLRKWKVNSGTAVDESSSAGWQNLGTFSTLSEVRCVGISPYGGAFSAIKLNGVLLVDSNDDDNDLLFDVPTNGTQSDTGAGGEVSGNYATLNPLNIHNSSNDTISNGNLECSMSGGSAGVQPSTIAFSSGKFYYEVVYGSNGGAGVVGIRRSDSRNFDNSYLYHGNGNKYTNGGSGTSYGATFTDGDVIGVAVDMDGGTLTFYKNGSSQGQAFSSISGEYTFFQGMFSGTTGSYTVNFGARPFAYSAPSNHKALCTTNLPTPTIADGSDYFDAKLWTGNSTDQRAITGYQFSPDFVWIKRRNASYAHPVMDTVRGLNSGHAGVLYTNATNAEDTGATSSIRSFNSDGFNLGTDGGVNLNNSTYVGWAWDAGSSTASNTDGSIISSVRANQSAGFSIVSYGNASDDDTIGHGLSASPHLIITKNRDSSSNWNVYFDGFGASDVMNLDNTDAKSTSGSNTFIKAVSNTTFTVGSSALVSGSDDFIAYCFAPVAGYSAFGSYTGNASADGPFVHTGFRPALTIIKCSSTSNSYTNWDINDSARDTYNVADATLAANLSDDENSANIGTQNIDFLSNGFKIRQATSSSKNLSGATYVWAAWAENPFQANGGLAR